MYMYTQGVVYAMKLAGIVHKSDMYISKGLLVFSPALNAAVGVVGEIK